MGRINTVVTSKETILKVCRGIAAAKGLSALNMRSVSELCNIALGTLYNYFSNKEELLIATVESVWQDIFHMDQESNTMLPFPKYVSYIFARVQNGTKKYPNFFTAHSAGLFYVEKDKAKSMMGHYFTHMKIGMTEVIKADRNIRKNVFSAEFTEDDFADFVLNNMLILLSRGSTNCTTLIEIISRVIYENEKITLI